MKLGISPNGSIGVADPGAGQEGIYHLGLGGQEEMRYADGGYVAGKP